MTEFAQSSSVSSFTNNYESPFTYASPADILKKYKSKVNYKSAFSYSYSPLSDFEEETEGNSFKESFFSRAVRKIIIYLCYVIVFISFPISAWICLKKIHALERLVVLRLGRLQPVVSPGYCLVFPVVDCWTRVDLQPKVFCVPVSQLLTADGGIVEVSAEIKYTVSHVTHYVLKLQCQESTFRDLCEHFLRNLISAKQQLQLQNADSISYYMKVELNKTILSWGLEILNIAIPTIKVVKEGEMPDALNTVFAALKSLITNDNMPFPVPNESTQPMIETTNFSATKTVSADVDPVDKIKNLIEESANKSSLQGVSANCELKVSDENSIRILHITFEDGNTSVTEISSELPDKDITISLTSSTLKEILDMQINPMDAYFDGKIQVFGNWKLLGNFTNLLS